MQSGVLQHPGQHAGGGGFAVGACYGQHMAALEHMFSQPLRATGVGRARVQNGFHQREFGGSISEPRAADDVADHEHVRLQRHLFSAETLDQFDAQAPELVTHGGVNAGIAAGYFVARFTRQRGQSTHEGAANAQDMNMHGPYSTVGN